MADGGAAQTFGTLEFLKEAKEVREKHNRDPCATKIVDLESARKEVAVARRLVCEFLRAYDPLLQSSSGLDLLAASTQEVEQVNFTSREKLAQHGTPMMAKFSRSQSLNLLECDFSGASLLQDLKEDSFASLARADTADPARACMSLSSLSIDSQSGISLLHVAMGDPIVPMISTGELPAARMSAKRGRAPSSQLPLTVKIPRGGCEGKQDWEEEDTPGATALAFPSGLVPRDVRGNKRMGKWSADERQRLQEAVQEYGNRVQWTVVAQKVGTRSGPQCSQHWHRTMSPKRRLGPWTQEEDDTLRGLVHGDGEGPWPPISDQMRKMGFQRTTKQCRERWQNHLQPSLRCGPFSPAEDKAILKVFAECGKWDWKRMKQEPALKGRTRERVTRRLESLRRKMARADAYNE